MGIGKVNTLGADSIAKINTLAKASISKISSTLASFAAAFTNTKAVSKSTTTGAANSIQIEETTDTNFIFTQNSAFSIGFWIKVGWNNTLNTNKKYESWKDDKKLKGSLILGFSAVYYLLDRFLGNGDKSYALNTYLKKYLGNTSPSELESKTAGNLQDVLIARRVIDKCNTLIENKLLKKENGDLFKNKVGEEILEKASLGDPSK